MNTLLNWILTLLFRLLICAHIVTILNLVNLFKNIINNYYNIFNFYTEKKIFSTSPKLVANLCCMLFNMITLTELDLHKLDQNNQLVHALIMYVTILYLLKRVLSCLIFNFLVQNPRMYLIQLCNSIHLCSLIS